MLQAGPASIQGGWSKLAVLLFLPIFALQAAGQRASEYQLKAAFVYNFTKFIDWLGESVRSLTFQICVLGQNPFGSELTQLTDGKVIEGHPVQVLIVTNYHLARSCQVVFISASENAHMKEILSALRGRSVLTVGDSQGFVDAGGMIELLVEDERMRFEVNLHAANEARLKISAKLLSLAKAVLS
jgi:YfiR/HmsC-like